MNKPDSPEQKAQPIPEWVIEAVPSHAQNAAGVQVRHVPSGLSASCGAHPVMSENKRIAQAMVKAGLALFPVEPKPTVLRHNLPEIKIHFDGGTPCNVPSKGYGIGYGSYSINGSDPVRVSHGVPCSNNAAELLTLCCALESVADELAKDRHFLVQGDSQVALKWLNIAAGNRKPSKATGSPLFLKAIDRLRQAAGRFTSIRGQWLPRQHAVRAFGH